MVALARSNLYDIRPRGRYIVRLPRPHAAQVEVLRTAARFNVLACGRRFGKTTLGIERACRAAIDGAPVGWFSPTYKDSAEAWRLLKRTLAPITARCSEAERRIELVTGGVVDMWTLNNPDNGRGRSYRRIIVDEAAKVADLERAWTETLRATLADLRGDAWFLSTPRGHNYFWHLYNMAASHNDWHSWRMPTSVNPYIPPDEIEDAQHQLPASAFAQEFLAEFTDDAGAVFRNVRNCIDRTLPAAGPVAGRTYYGGLDWAQTNDFTVLAIVDDAGALVALERFNRLAWEVQYGRVAAATAHWHLAGGLAELNSIGSPNLEQLHAGGLSQWRGFTTTLDSKAQIIQALVLAFERGDIRVPNDPVLVAELEAFETTRLPSGKWRYAAPEEMHDDTVIALALAWEARQSGGPVMLFEVWG